MEDPIVHSKKLTRKGFQDLYSNCETGEIKVNPYLMWLRCCSGRVSLAFTLSCKDSPFDIPCPAFQEPTLNLFSTTMRKRCQKSEDNTFLTVMDYRSRASLMSLQVDFHIEMNGSQRLPGGWEINLKNLLYTLENSRQECKTGDLHLMG